MDVSASCPPMPALRWRLGVDVKNSLEQPLGRWQHLQVDTAVARGKLYLARQRGEDIQEGWAIDQDGRPTTDPVAGIAGNILPFAEHKGYAIATMMDILSGLLSGSHFGADVVGRYVTKGRSGVGHLAIALNIESFQRLLDFNSDMERLVNGIKNASRCPRTNEIFYPGELEACADDHHRLVGIALPHDTIDELNSGARKLGIVDLKACSH